MSATASGAIELLRRSLEGWTRLLGGGPIEQRIVDVNRQLVEAEERLERLRAGGSDRMLETQEVRVQRLRAELDALLAQARAEAEGFATQRREADEGRRAAESERLAEVVAGIERRLQQQLYDLAGDRIRKVRDEEARAIAELERLRQQGAEPARVDALIAQRRELAQRQIEEVERPLREAAERRAETERRAAATRVAANERVVAGMLRELELLTTLDGVERERQRFVDQALARLSEPTAERVRAVERLAAALFDEARAQEAALEASEQVERLALDIARAYDVMRERTGGAVEALERWREQTLAALDEADERYEEHARKVEAIYDERLPRAREADRRHARRAIAGVLDARRRNPRLFD